MCIKGTDINIQGEQINITTETVKQAVRKLKNKRAPGPEGHTYKVWHGKTV